MNAWNHHETHNYIEELDNAMDIAQAKGARSTLVLMKGLAFVVASSKPDSCYCDSRGQDEGQPIYFN